MTIDLIEEHYCFGGIQRVYAHQSSVNHCMMRFGIFLPPQIHTQCVPVLYWLSGLTCTEQNFITKSGAQRMAAQLGLALVTPDTSPRGVHLPGDQDSYDFGIGAGFYVDATQDPWEKYYQMSTYVCEELPNLLQRYFPLDEQACGIFGHSMGGHGALTLAFKNPKKYRSVSAFSPICAPTQCAWGQKAFTGYLGEDEEQWRGYDACHLIVERGWPHKKILIDQGTQDPYLQEQLKPELFQQACLNASVDLNLRMQEGYDHSYYFIASFIEEHLTFHASLLKGN
ncbi:S-formylglutathione hydrolase [Legionella longbeachae]|uniref:S-formylglutathione hydrolase n=1 Tax=Legionella longbeachae serogroup 1 (strain NSW150) TaxID=661367 RepID=D3HKD5_LEGLN|nr:S-formylglutathione hydrolase [Legionella longbeachae]EEZ93980.1 S-formylglutathione hydrolase [Legionella longbeachae D-4968]CBJ12899.1 S-formylglutathione hydrolase [Legionella longbeachae NSW150]VEE03416.1 S-formylglutathione hydrolase [Legionella oakridgensis]ARM33170.1 S-formylglutathione hydrolase [Legionella longbeachae]